MILYLYKSLVCIKCGRYKTAISSNFKELLTHSLLSMRSELWRRCSSTAWYSPFEKSKNSKIGLGTYVRNHLNFHLKPVPSKNIENWRSFSILSLYIFEKKNFWILGNPLFRHLILNFLFFESIHIILRIIIRQ